MKSIALYSTLLPLALTAGLLFVAPSIVSPDSKQPVASSNSQLGNSRTGEEPTRLYLPDDLDATLWAQTPMFNNPTSMDIDARGRVWVTEAVNYRTANDEDKGTDRLEHPDGERIMILQDTDGDGKADLSKMFVQDPDIISPLGIAVVGNKIIVSCSPNLIIYTDENGDDRPDRKEILLTGFGGLDHDSGLHSLVAGPDGKYYFTVGNAGPNVVTDQAGFVLRSGRSDEGGTSSNAGNNQVSDDGRVWTGGLTLRINPDGTGLKVLSHNARNSYETVVDSYGNLWQSDNDDKAMASRTNWLMEGSNTGFSSTDGSRNGQNDQRPGQSVQTAHWHQEDPGVLPVGEVTDVGSPRGMVMYEGDALGLTYRGMLLSADAGRNVVFGFKPEPMGAGYRMPKTNVVSTFSEGDNDTQSSAKVADTRTWFRPSDVAVGTDGAIYVADWYDPTAGENKMDDRKGIGRIYRITPRSKNPRVPKIDLSSTKGQIDALLSPAVNVRMSGFLAMKAQGQKVLEPVMELMSSTNPYHRARAIFLMVHLGPEGQFEVERMLKAVDASVRIAALRALRSITPENTRANPDLTASQRALLPLLGNLSLDRNAGVRREVAVAVRDMPYRDSRYIIQNLVKGYDGQDRYYLNALGMAANGKQDYVFADLRPTLPENPADWDTRTANLVWELHPTAAVPMLAQRANSPSLSVDARKQTITTLGFMSDTSAVRALTDLARSPDNDVATQARYWITPRRNGDVVKAAVKKEVLPQKMPTVEQRMLAKRQELLSDSKSDTEKRRTVLDMARTAEGGRMLVDLAADNKLSDELIRVVGPTMLRNPDQTVRTMAKQYFTAKPTKPADEPTQWEPSATKPVETKQMVAAKPTVEKVTPTVDTKTTAITTPAIEKTAMLAGNQKAGLTVFNAKCASCHKYGNLGNNIGPELTQIHQKLSPDALMESVVNPSASIASGYEAWLITTKKGQTFYGFLVGDNEQSVIIKGATGQQHTIPADQVQSRRQYKTSLMPTADALKLDQQQLTDLTTFLLKQ